MSEPSQTPGFGPDPIPTTDVEPDTSIVMARLVSDPPLAQPLGWRATIDQSTMYSWWLVLLTLSGSVLAYLFTSGIVAAIGVLIVSRGELPTVVNDELMAEVMLNRTAFVLTVLLPQLALIALPLVAGCLLPAGPRRTLRLVRGRWPLWTWIAVGLATPLVSTLLALLLSPLMEESEALKTMTNWFQHHGKSGFLIPLVLLIGVTPSICEELLFRGFLQPRLTRLMPPALGVILASVAFAAMHIDPIHALGVLPLGLWLGFVSYQSGSLFPAMIGHLVNNVLSVLLVMGDDAEILDAPPVGVAAFIFFGGLFGVFGVGIAWWRYRKSDGRMSVK